MRSSVATGKILFTAPCNSRVADDNRQVPPREHVQIIISSNFQPSGQNNNPELAMQGASKTRTRLSYYSVYLVALHARRRGTGTAAASSNNIMVDYDRRNMSSCRSIITRKLSTNNTWSMHMITPVMRSITRQCLQPGSKKHYTTPSTKSAKLIRKYVKFPPTILPRCIVLLYPFKRILPVWQFCPVNPGAHWQEKLPIPSLQVPPFWQRTPKQSLISDGNNSHYHYVLAILL